MPTRFKPSLPLSWAAVIVVLVCRPCALSPSGDTVTCGITGRCDVDCWEILIKDTFCST